MSLLRLGFAAFLLLVAPCSPLGAETPPARTWVDAAREQHGEPGERAARFLADNMPAQDRKSVSEAFLLENLSLALQARVEFPWAKAVSEDLFLNDVLPYAVLDEPRDPWRKELLEKARPLVAGATTATEAVQRLNKELFNVLKLHYNLKRERNNQSYRESTRSGMATCTGLSIVLIEACRSVGIPARAAGIAQWPQKSGNHTWVEFWDNGWHFVGADEYDPAGPDRGWFVEDAKEANDDDPMTGIYASSWKISGTWFPLAWNPGAIVPGVRITERYAAPAGERRGTKVYFRVRSGPETSDSRVAAEISVVDDAGNVAAKVLTKTAPADLNDMPAVVLSPKLGYRCLVTREGATREALLTVGDTTAQTCDLTWDSLPEPLTDFPEFSAWLKIAREHRPSPPERALSLAEAGNVKAWLWQDLRASLAKQRDHELLDQDLKAGGKDLRFTVSRFGEAPWGERSLWISMHGGGNAPEELNDQQWRNQSRLYKLDEGFYVAPRAPTNTWNLWHEDHIDDFFARLIDGYVALRGVNPNRVYLLGYSAGGDGVYQLAPRLADRLAAAGMMAGHPNDARPDNLRNLPFALYMGALDDAYGRNDVAREWGAKLDQLQKDDAGGYVHRVRLVEGKGHWMDHVDAEALPWMATFSRDPWPRKLVWTQGNRLHRRFSWVALPAEQPAAKEFSLKAHVDGQTIVLDTTDYHQVVLRLSDRLLNLDEPVTVIANGKTVFTGRVLRSVGALVTSLEERADPETAASALLPVSW